MTRRSRCATCAVHILTASALAILGLSLSACTSVSGTAAVSEKPRGLGAHAAVARGTRLDMTLPASVAETRLTDQAGNGFTLRSLRGRVVVLAPLLTLCQETCPMTSANIRQAAADADHAGTRTEFVELTVDPARDTVARLDAYQRLYGHLPHWHFATGRPAAVNALWRALGVSMQKRPIDEKVRDWLTGSLLKHPYDIEHQDVVFVLGPAGHIRWLTIGRPDSRDHPLPATLRGFLNAEGRHNLRVPGAGSWTARDIEHAVRYVDRVTGPR
jgi:cytochrome oxidase Cu insertion factor (SCO1/SenC/PrrC family)